MSRDPLQQRLEMVRIEGPEAVLPPDAALDLGPCHRERVLHLAAPVQLGSVWKTSGP